MAALVGGGFRSASVDTAAAAVTLPEPVTFSYVDGGDARQTLDLYKPSGAGPFPVVVWFHGGAWSAGDKRQDTAVFAAFADRYAVVSVDYRYASRSSYPATTDDAVAALRSIRQQGAQQGLDTDRMAVLGFSAGGHLAALAGLQAPEGVELIATLSAPTDLTKLFDERHPGEIRQLVDCWSATGCERVVAQVDPDSYVTVGSPPVFIQHGTEDPLVPLTVPASFRQTLQAADVATTTEVIRGMGHTYRITPALVSAVDEALAP